MRTKDKKDVKYMIISLAIMGLVILFLFMFLIASVILDIQDKQIRMTDSMNKMHDVAVSEIIENRETIYTWIIDYDMPGADGRVRGK